MATTLKEPPQSIIALAEAMAMQSPCAKSKRGAVLFKKSEFAEEVYGSGFNGQPPPFTCTGTDRCRELCGKLCEHAEGRAIRQAEGSIAVTSGHAEAVGGLELVHVKIGNDGRLVSGGPPSCWQCSRAILDCGFVAGVWLYEATTDDRCPHLDLPKAACSFCQGIDCIADRGKCDAIGMCHHDVVERHGSSPLVAARWRFYEAEEFHRLSLAANGMEF